MHIISEESLGKAYESSVKYVLNHGKTVITEDNETTLESDPICICVENPLSFPTYSDLNPIKFNFLEQYAHDLINGTKSVFDYDYHTRLFEWGSHWTDIPINQIQMIINKLKDHSESRRAIAITSEPNVDISCKNIPCLQFLQCTVRNKKLNMTVVFRSNDILLASGANMYALAKLQRYIALQTGYEIGKYTHIALIPHIYCARDASCIDKFNTTVNMTKPLIYDNP